MFWPSPLVTQTILTILFLQEDSCNISLEISSQLPTEAAHTAASGSVTGVTDVTGVNEFNVDVSTFAPTVPEASAPKWTFSTFLAVLVEYLGFPWISCMHHDASSPTMFHCEPFDQGHYNPYAIPLYQGLKSSKHDFSSYFAWTLTGRQWPVLRGGPESTEVGESEISETREMCEQKHWEDSETIWKIAEHKCSEMAVVGRAHLVRFLSCGGCESACDNYIHVLLACFSQVMGRARGEHHISWGIFKHVQKLYYFQTSELPEG